MFFMIDTIDIANMLMITYTKLQKASVKVSRWFNENAMIGNQDKCHFMSSPDITTKFCYLLEY